MDQKRKLGELISMNSIRPGVIHIFEGEKVFKYEQKITIGKDETNTNPIFDNRIADFHCSFQFQDGQVVLRNLTSLGTYLNKQKMGLDLEVNLEHGDHIHLLCQGKEVTEKQFIAYMFFKYENKKKKTKKESKSKQTIIEQIGDNLICVICQDIYYEGVAVSPCGHVFCGYCLQGWENENNLCPICRVKMRNITKAFQLNKIINAIVELNPDIELKQKPANKYFLQGENHYQSANESDSRESESLSDSVSESLSDSVSESEESQNEVIRRAQGPLDDQLQSFINQFEQRLENSFNRFISQFEQVIQPYRGLNQLQNIQQNAQQNRQHNNAQQNQQNGQAQNRQQYNGQK